MPVRKTVAAFVWLTRIVIAEKRLIRATTLPRAEIAQLVPKFRSGPDRIFHMWPQGGTWFGPDRNHIGL